MMVTYQIRTLPLATDSNASLPVGNYKLALEEDAGDFDDYFEEYDELEEIGYTDLSGVQSLLIVNIFALGIIAGLLIGGIFWKKL